MESRKLRDGFGGYRARLLENLREHGIEDLTVLRAFGEIPRHLFVPEAVRHRAYEDAALPIGKGQTISQPSTQATYLQSIGLRGSERVLEVGTGSGYQTALLSMLAGSVVSIERVPELADRARTALQEAGITGVTVVVGDGSLGWRPFAPFDAILVAAAGPKIPEPLLEQLADGGRLVTPVDDGGVQRLVLVRRRGTQFEETPLGEARFVPLIGRHGFTEPASS